MFKLIDDLMKKITNHISTQPVYAASDNYSYSCRSCDGECGSGCSGAYCAQGCGSDCSSSVYNH